MYHNNNEGNGHDDDDDFQAAAAAAASATTCANIAHWSIHKQALFADDSTKESVNVPSSHRYLHILAAQGTTYIQSHCQTSDIGNLAYIALYAESLHVQGRALESLAIINRAITHGTQDMLCGLAVMLIGAIIVMGFLTYALRGRKREESTPSLIHSVTSRTSPTHPLPSLPSLPDGNNDEDHHDDDNDDHIM